MLTLKIDQLCAGLFSTKEIKNSYFDPCLECAVPKGWSNYTTSITEQGVAGLMHLVKYFSEVLIAL